MLVHFLILNWQRKPGPGGIYLKRFYCSRFCSSDFWCISGSICYCTKHRHVWKVLPANLQLLCCRTPVNLPAMHASNLLFRPSIMLQGLLAHYAAEVLLNAPAVLGSLDLLLNPTGLFHSVGLGFEDLVSLPLAALEARSPSQVCIYQYMNLLPLCLRHCLF